MIAFLTRSTSCYVVPLMLAVATWYALVLWLYWNPWFAWGVCFLLAIVTGRVALKRWDDFLRPHSRTGRESLEFSGRLLGQLALVPLAGMAADYLSVKYGILNPTLLAFVSSGGMLTLLSSLGDSGEKHIRGRKLCTYEEAQKCAEKTLPEVDPGMLIGGVRVPLLGPVKHAFIAGQTGSGKTLSIQIMMESVLPMIRQQRGWRAFVYDDKGDLMPMLRGIDQNQRIELLNPFDARSAAWDIAVDVQNPESVFEVASVLIPDQSESQPYFRNASRMLMQGVMEAFIKQAPGEWTLRDVIYALGAVDTIKEVIAPHPQIKRDLQDTIGDDISFRNVMSTMKTILMPYRSIAEAWHRAWQAGSRVSLSEWISGEFVLVMGKSERHREASNAMTRAIFSRLSALLQQEPTLPGGKTWLFLDEAREAAKLDGLKSLLNKGRSKGITAVLGFQAIEGMRDVYGENVADEILGQCSYRACLRAESSKTAEWASALFGRAEVLVEEGSTGPHGESISEKHDTRNVLLESQFMELPVSGPDNGLCGYYLMANIGAYRADIRWDSVMKLVSPPADIPDFVPHPASSDLSLSEWTPDDRRRLGLDDGYPPLSQRGNNDQPDDDGPDLVDLFPRA